MLDGRTLMAAVGGDGSGRRRCAVIRRRALLLITVISVLVHHADTHFATVPQDDRAGWIYGVSDKVDWQPAALIAAVQSTDSRLRTESPWRRPANSVYPRHRRRSKTDPYGRLIAGSAWKRRSMYNITVSPRYVYYYLRTRMYCFQGRLLCLSVFVCLCVCQS